ncbi:unnamed protein product, partial [Staurois parvus]
MDFQQLADVADKWCSNTPFDLIATEETERRMDFYADPGVSFYVLCPDNGCGDNFHVWSESEDCLPFLQLAQDYISSCGKRRRFMKYWRKFSSHSGHYLVSQMWMMTRLKNIMRMWKRMNQRQITSRWGSASS